MIYQSVVFNCMSNEQNNSNNTLHKFTLHVYEDYRLGRFELSP